MLNKVYQLVKPRQIVPIYQNIDLQTGELLIRPTFLSICHADQRYYQGTRSEEVLQKKLPMALIHEAIGKVVYDPTNTFKKGERVVMIPNTPCEKDDVIAENYLRSSRFRASGFDGFMQEYVSMVPDRVLSIPEKVPDTVAAFTEIISVSYHAVTRFKAFSHRRKRNIGIWGDGNLGYITALLLHCILPDTRITVFGVHEYKLQDFSFVNDTYLVNKIPENLYVDHAFECVGGSASGNAIDQIINHINPEGTISLLGVSETSIPINTRLVLEKGLRLFGSSRSGREDFEGLLKLYMERPEIINYFERIVGIVQEVRNVMDINSIFEADIHKNAGKTILVWNV